MRAASAPGLAIDSTTHSAKTLQKTYQKQLSTSIWTKQRPSTAPGRGQRQRLQTSLPPPCVAAPSKSHTPAAVTKEFPPWSLTMDFSSIPGKIPQPNSAGSFPKRETRSQQRRFSGVSLHYPAKGMPHQNAFLCRWRPPASSEC